MELKDFIAQTLIQIVQGSVEASKAVSELGAAVSPTHSVKADSAMLGAASDGSGRQVQAVRFDVGILAESDSSAQGGGGIKVMGIQVGGSLAEGDRHQHTSRIQFVVPLALPVDPVSKAGADERARKANEAIANAGRSLGARF